MTRVLVPGHPDYEMERLMSAISVAMRDQPAVPAPVIKLSPRMEPPEVPQFAPNRKGKGKKSRRRW